MPSQPLLRKHSPAEKLHVLSAHRARRADWLQVAENNGISRAVAYRIVASGRVEDLPRGGARGSVVKITEEARNKLEEYLNENCTFTLEAMRTMLFLDTEINVSTSTICRHLLGMLYTVKQTRIEP
ncbi:hypothetical protein AM588_10009596 [Phytophthora nicotianae]|uniref:Uncharacterized protein n=1 Tax=Phytophthora nicotianae TaxID=4792 RepID=A0A0W8D9Y3_PHYNI|nr:hypothetical protein AM588_10009596 [Phytophthora nicotianae]